MSKNLTLTLKIDANGNLVSVMDQASQKVKTFGKSVDDAGNASDKLSNRLTDMAHIAATVFSVTQVYQFHAALLQTTAQLESMGKAYGAIFGKNEGVQQMQFITSVADQMGLKFADAAQQFKGFAAATAGTALEGAHTQSIFLATASAAATLGLSTEQSGRAFLAMSQMAGKGVVSMEELRGQLAEAIPGAVGLAANAMGVTIAELNKMVESGTVLSSDLLPKLADELQKMYGASANGASNVTAELNRLDNATTALGAAYTSGWADDATVIIRDMTTFFTDPSVIAGAKSLGESVGTLMRTISDNKEAVLTVTGALIGLLRAGGVGAIVGGIGGFSLSQIINDTDVQRIKSLKAELADLKPNAFNWQSVSWRRKQLEDEIAYLEDWAEVSKSTYKVVYDTAAKAEADKSAAALSEAKKRATIAGQEFDEWSKGIDALNKYDFEQRKKSLADWEAGERKKASLAQQASKEILQAKKRAQDEEYDYFEKNLQAQEKAQQDYQKSVSDTFDSVRRELDPTIDLYEAYNKKVQAVTAITLAGSADQEAMLKKLQENLNNQLDELRNKNEGTADAVRVAWEQSIKRLDDAFADVWRDIFNGAEDFGSSLKRWFTSLLAELAHAAITKPIVISMTGAMGLGGSGSAMASSIGSSAAGSYIGSALGGIGAGLGALGAGASATIAGWGSAVGLTSATSQAGMLAAQTGAFGMQGAALTGQAMAGASGSIMSTIGASMPYVAAFFALDAALGSVVSKGIVTGITGGSYELKHVTAKLTAFSDTIDSSIIKIERKDGGWGNKSKTRKTELGTAELDQAMQDMYSAVYDSVAENATRLGFTVAENFTASVEMSVKGKSSEEIMQSFNEMFTQIGDKLVASASGLSEALAPFQQQGETSYQTLSRLTAQFDAFNYPIGRLNDTLATLNMTTLGAVDSLVAMAGGIQNLQSMQSNFIDAFYTDAQKAELTAESVSSVFNSLNLAIPATESELVSLVRSLDLTTETGQRAYVAITGATQLLDQYYSTIAQSSVVLEQSIAAAERAAAERAAGERAAALAGDKKLKELKSGIVVSSEYSGIEAKLSEIYSAVAPAAEYQAKIKDGIQEYLATELIALPILKEQANLLAGIAATIPNGFSDLRVMMAEISRVSTSIDVLKTLSQLDNSGLITAIHIRDAALLGAGQTRSVNDVASLRYRERFDDTTALKLAAMLDQVLAPFADLTKSVGTLTKGLSQLNSLTEENKVSAEAYGFWLDKLTNQYGVLTSSITLTESGLVELNDAFKVSATIGQTVNKANLLKATLGVLTRGIDQGVNQLMTSADDYAKSVKNTIADVKSYTDNKGLFNAAIDAINAPLDAAKRVKAELSKNIKSIRELMVDATGDELDRLANALKTSNFAYTKAAKEIKEYESTYSFIATAAEKLSQLVTSPTIESGLAQLPNLITDFDTSFSGLSQSVNESLGLVIGSLEQGNNDSIYSAFMQLNDLFNDGAITAEQYTKMIGAVEKAYIEGVDSIEKAYERLKNTEKTYEQIAQERIALEDQLNQLTLSSDELRALELAKIDESNRYLQERIWQLMDEKTAQEEAAQAAEDLKTAWQSATDSIQEEINRILGIGAGNALTYQQAQSQFSQATAMALLGDKQAAADLPAFSRTMLELAETQARTAEELALIKGQTAASLVYTLSNMNRGLMDKAPFIQVPAFADGGIHQGGIRLVGENGPELEVTGSSRIFNAQQTQAILKGSNNNNADVVAELKAVRAELAQSRKERNQLLSMLNEQTKNVADNTEYLMVWDSSTLPPMAAT